MEDPITRKPIYKIKDLETLKVVTDSLRMQILEVLDSAPQTIGYVAEKLGLASSRLYYHFGLLESHGLIRVVETRTVNNIIEKLYWVTAENVVVDSDILNYSSEDGPEYIGQLVRSTLDATREDILRSLEALKFNVAHGTKDTNMALAVVRQKKRIKAETYNEFMDKINAILNEFTNLPEVAETEPEANVYNLTCFFYPSHYYEDDTEPREED